MIIAENNRTTISSQEFDSVSFGIDDKDLSHIFEMLRNHYSNKPRAIIREYGTNCADIHIETGKLEVPFHVCLPTNLDPSLKFRDFGTGLSEDEVKNIFAFYGKSTKRASNSVTGTYGIGGKSAFCYSDSFLIISYYEGKKNIYNCYLDESGLGRIAVMSSENSSEESGLEVIVPIKPQDVSSFLKEVAFTFSFFKVKPVITNAKETGYDYDYLNSLIDNKGEPLFTGNGWRLYQTSSYSKPYVIMGNVPYPIDYDNIGIESEITQELLNSQLEIDVELGEIDILSTREALKYTEKTKKFLTEKLESILSEIEIAISNHFNSAENIWEAKASFQSFFNSDNILGRIFRNHRHALNIKWNGIEITNRYIRIPDDINGVTLKRYSVSENYRRRRRHSYSGSYNYSINSEELTQIDANNSHSIYINDKPGQIDQRVYTDCKINHKQYVYVLSYTDQAEFDRFLAESYLDSVNIPMLSTLAPTAFNGKNVNTYEASPEAKAKVLIFTNAGEWRYPKDDWGVVDINLNKDEGVYVEINRFKVINYCNVGHRSNNGDFNNYLEFWKDMGILDLPVYGFKSQLARQLRDNPLSKKAKNWKHLKDYLTEKVNEFITGRNLSAAMAIQKISYNSSTKYEFINWFAELPIKSDLHTKYKNLFATLKDPDLTKAIECCSKIGIEIKHDENIGEELKSDVADILRKYPILDSLKSAECDKKKVAGYIELVDKN